MVRRDGEPGQSDAGETVTDAVERRATGADHEHALVVVDELTDRVDDGLRPSGAGQRVHGEGVTGGDPGEHPLLLGVGVQQQGVGGGRTLVRADDHGVGTAHADAGTVVGMPREGVQQRVVEVVRVARHARAHVGERRDDQARVHDEGRHVRGQAADVVDDRLRFEHALVVRETCEGGAVDLDAEMRAERARELGVHHEGAVQLELEVAVVPADGEGTQQHGGRPLHSPDLPRGEADGQMHGLETAGGAQLDVLRGDAVGGHACRAQGDLVAEEVGEHRRAPRDELRERARVRLGDVDARVKRVVEPQQCRPAAQGCRLGADAIALGVGDVADHDAGLRQSQLARIDGRHRIVSVGTDHGTVLSSPHTCQTKPVDRVTPVAAASFATIGDTPHHRRFLPRRRISGILPSSGRRPRGALRR